jgi:hypothetical protein
LPQHLGAEILLVWTPWAQGHAYCIDELGGATQNLLARNAGDDAPWRDAAVLGFLGWIVAAADAEVFLLPLLIARTAAHLLAQNLRYELTQGREFSEATAARIDARYSNYLATHTNKRGHALQHRSSN